MTAPASFNPAWQKYDQWRERSLNHNASHHWLMSHLNQAAIFHHCSFSQASIAPCAEDLVIVIRCDGTSIPRVSLWLQFNLASTPLFCSITYRSLHIHLVLCSGGRWIMLMFLKVCSNWSTQSLKKICRCYTAGLWYCRLTRTTGHTRQLWLVW